MDEMRRTGAQADEGSERTSGQAGGRADERTGADNGRMGERVDGRTGRRTGGRQISEGKTPDLMRQLTWPWEIQRGRPRVTVKLPHLPPPSR